MTDFKALVSAETAPHIEAGAVKLPERIGRYRVDRLLGKGGFGLVFLAFDEQLKRAVALKVPHSERIAGPDDAKEYLAEAQTVANLDHPTIVPVYDVGSTAEFPCYIVSKFIEGTSLAEKIKETRLSFCEAAELVEAVAEALQYAHRQGLVHRDVKPGNILIDRAGKPFVVDFGLALQEEDLGKGPRYAGTPGYMSPEQVKGEGHRVDGRSDIFSLGVVFYELLTARRPFHAESKEELFDQINSHEPRPPRQYDETIPKELERICLKMLSKRATDRYMTAKDLTDDLRIWLSGQEEDDKQAARNLRALSGTQAVGVTPPATPHSDSQPIKIVPKGLRSFDEHDADFFLELLPGPRDREGLPDSIRFWKTRIEETDPDKTFSVGLIYGPSGCGKTSLVKAGLLPRLSENVSSVYVEATADETESRLLKGLSRHSPGLAAHLNLKDSITALRRGQGIPAGKKIFIIIDQFEQWLHAKKEDETDLLQALRQCDGEHVQCVVMVRDDFWMAATQFMRELEIRLLEGHNSAPVDRFLTRHAEKVLTAFGRAFSVLSQDAGQVSNDQKEFIKQAVNGLAEGGKAVCVRLALFAEMMKDKSWTPATLKEVGGTQGVGVTFLEETFSTSTAPPEHRYHQKAARCVLKALLPEAGSDIKGNMRSHRELLEQSGYAARSKDFGDLIEILDSNIRLITPTDLEGAASDDGSSSKAEAGQKYYQLTHDYLVPSLREWLTRKQKETRRGRAELRLAERSAHWNGKPENRRLPSLWEYLNIRLLATGKNWTESQRKMMNRAGRVHGVRSGLVTLAAAMVIAAGFFISREVEDRQNRIYANALVQSLAAVNTADIENLIGELSKYRQWTFPQLEEVVNDKNSESKEKLHGSLALVGSDPSKVDYLADRLLTGKAEEVPVIVKFLSPYKDRLGNQLWQSATSGPSEQRIRAAAALAAYDPQNNAWQEVNTDVVTALVSVPTVEAKQWIDMLRPVRTQLVEPLETRYRVRNPNRDAERPLTAAALADYCQSDSQKLTDLILTADDDREFLPLLQSLRSHHELTSPALRKVLSQSAPIAWTRFGVSPALRNVLPKTGTRDIRDAFWKKQANAAVCLFELGEQEAVWPLLEHTSLRSFIIDRLPDSLKGIPNPSLRSFIIDRLARLGADSGTLAGHLVQETDPSIQQAVILALGEFDAGRISNEHRQSMVERLVNLYSTNADSGVHSAAAWTLQQWQEEKTIKRLDAQLRSASSQGKRNWFINAQGQTFVVVDGSVQSVMRGVMGGSARKVPLSRRFAVAAHEVTVAQFQQFRKDHDYNANYAPQSDCPVDNVSWYDAVAYCNWLSEQEGIPKDQLCYEPNEKGDYAEGMKIPADLLKRTGYRLPTEAEWEFACRAGTTTAFSLGASEELLDRYAWFNINSKNRLWPVGRLKPNGLGLFDMHGNACEWSHDLLQSKSNDAVEVMLKNNEYRVLRGGAFNDQPSVVRSASRGYDHPINRVLTIGFRAARTYP